ncbi:MAG TPA: DUF305 domain-containing protein [Gemmatimonadaceae bacterium]|nr:DUF305 domain-containing protein [Gemmatimonadaceae bacterium]
MFPLLFRAATGCALVLVTWALPRAADAQAPMSGVEQARQDSIRRPYTKADIGFMSGMIYHHAQAVKMANWAPSHGASPALQIYCGRVAMAQTAEIGLMSDWLRDRNQPVPNPDADDMGGMPGMSGMSGMQSHIMPGMLTPEQMKQLDAARGPEFDRLFLTYMIQHHRGAIQMVDTLLATPAAAQDEIVFKFANDVQADQSTEIDRMQQMLDAMKAGSR